MASLVNARAAINVACHLESATMSAKLGLQIEASTPATLLIDSQEVARRLDLSERTVWRLCSAGKLPKPVSIGSRSKRWRVEEIAAWVAAGCPPRNVWETTPKPGNRK